MKKGIVMTSYRSLRCIAALLIVWGLILSAMPGWAAPARSKAPANLLPAEFKGEDVKDYYVGPGAKDAGMIQTVIGYVIVARDGTNQAYYAAPGDRLFEKDIVFTLKGSKCRFQMNGQDVVTMGENTRLGLKTIEANPQAQTKTTVFSMLKGKAMFYAMRLFRYRSTSMTVETPTAVSGVRGTKWGVEVAELEGNPASKPAGKPAASLPVLVADNAPDGGFRHLATYILSETQGGGANFYSINGQTTVISFSGTVFTSPTAPPSSGAPPQIIQLSPGQMTTVAAGAQPTTPTLAPANIMNRFLEDTGVPGVQASMPLTPSPQPPLPLQSHPEIQLVQLTMPRDITPIVQGVGAQTNGGGQRPSTHFGFFSGQLSWYNSSCSLWDYSTTLTSSALQDFSTTATAVSGSKTLTINGASKTMTAYSDPPYSASPTGQALQMAELGYNAYTEWGTWTQPTAFQVNGQQYSFNTTGYYIWGDKTQTMPATISGTYRGNAYGTMVWQSSGLQSQNMTGTFQTDVTFSGGSGSINNLQISTAGGGKSAGIANGQGTITGNTFTINSANVSINGGSGVLTGINQGAFYGASAQAVGGIWNVKDDGSVYRVTGAFQGTK